MNAVNVFHRFGGLLFLASGLYLSNFALGNSPGLDPVQGATQSKAPVPPSTPFQVVQREANSKTWQRTTFQRAPDGAVVSNEEKYVELATGMHYLKKGKWTPSEERIDLLPRGGAEAIHGQHQVYFPPDIYKGAIEIVTPDGKHLKSRPMGISYFDGTHSVLISELKHSTGRLVNLNQIVYPDAFTDFKADLVCTYRKSGFECDLVFREQPPAPGIFGLDPSASRLELLTEFFETPEPEKLPGKAAGHGGLHDTTLKFGRTSFGHGKAFVIGDTVAGTKFDDMSKQPVSKTWLHLEGRTFLVEELSYQQIAPGLQALQSPISRSRLPESPVLHRVSSSRLLTPERLVQADSTNFIQMAKADPGKQPGVVLDYIQLNSDQTDFTFQADTTYLISGPVFIEGTVTLEGGTVIKYAPSTNASLTAASVICKTARYRPAVFTAKDDDTVGEHVSGSTGTPGGYSADTALAIIDPTDTVTLQNLRVSYANVAIHCNGQLAAQDVQILHCGTGFFMDNAGLTLNNALIVDVDSAFNGYSYWGSAANLTVNGANYLAYDNDSVWDGFEMDNSIFANVGTLDGGVGVYGMYSAFYNSDNNYSFDPYYDVTNWPFQTVGAGSYYLSTNSPLRNAGTYINDTLAADLGRTTTYPPLVYSNLSISPVTTLSPQAVRDTDTPDLGYHYDPIDYFFGGVNLQSNLTFTAGTAVGWFQLPGSNGGPGYGIGLSDGLTVSFKGTVAAPDVFAFYDTVQEGNGLWKDRGWLSGIQNGGTYNPSNPAHLVGDFTRMFKLANDPGHFRDGPNGQPIQVIAKNSEFYGASGGYNLMLGFTNCLFYRGAIGQFTGDSQYSGENYRQIYRNCTFYGGEVDLGHGEGAPFWAVSIHDCSLDGTKLDFSPPWNDDISNWDWSWLDADYNALHNVNFVQEADLTDLPGDNNVYPAGFNWQTGWLGDFYLPTNSVVVDAGDQMADQIGLYHFTTRTDQVKDGDSTLDIGYHYVATDADGNPLDTNEDGILDYLEDINGDGVMNNGEANWNWNLKILVQPESQSVSVGQTVDLSVIAAGVGPLHYQWYSNSILLGGATSSTLTLHNIRVTDAGTYFVVVTNIYGSLTSSNAVVTVAPLPPTTRLPSGIVAWWRAENNALDSVGTNNGTLAGGASYVNGKAGKAFKFDGTSGYMTTLSNSPALDATNITVECWLYRQGASGSWDPVIKKSGTSNNGQVNGYSLEFSGDNIVFWIYNASGWHSSPSGSIQLGQWYHVAGVYDGTKLMCYINGQRVGTWATTSSGIVPATNPLRIGNDPGNPTSRFFNGLIDEASVYNRALSSNEIAAIYIAGATGKYTDSDYDGRGDVQESADNTDPANPGSVLQVQLGRWRFDNTNTWVGDQGQLPLIATNISGVASWDVNAVHIGDTNPAVLKYNEVDTNGANINLRNGTVRFWFKPDWSSTNAGGSGPQAEGRFIEVGSRATSNGWWGLVVNSSGTNIYFCTQTNALNTLTTNASAAIAWTSNQWHQVVLTYSTNKSSLYLDGQAVVTNGSAIANYPGPTARAAGFNVGSSDSGTNQAKGTFEDLETFNYVLSSAAILTNYSSIFPTILVPPSSQTVIQNNDVTFSVTAIGMAPLTYQWYSNSIAIADATNASVTLTAVQSSAAGTYSVAVMNPAGSVVGNAVLTVLVPPFITTQPVNQAVSPGNTATFTVVATGTQPLNYQWRRNGLALSNGSGISGATSNVMTISSAGARDSGIYTVTISNAAGTTNSYRALLTVRAAASLVAWGNNYYGQTDFPLDITNVLAVAAGGYHSLALKTNGTVVGWQLDGDGQIDIPAGLSNVLAIAAGGYHSLALKSDGTVVAWGDNSFEQSTLPTFPVATNIVTTTNIVEGVTNITFTTNITTVITTTNVVAIAAGLYHSLALKNDGTVVGWGYDQDGQMEVPPDLADTVAIAAGGYHGLALAVNGTVEGWGNNDYGQIDVPSGLSNVVAIAGGGFHSLALKNDGTVVGWGDDEYGQIDIPTNLAGVVAIAAGDFHSAALKSDGTVVSWGNDDYGQIDVPAGLTNVISITGGSYHGLGLGSLPPLITKQPQSQMASVGSDVSFSAGILGSSPLHCQWYFNSSPLADQTNRNLVILDIDTPNAGNYYVIATNNLGSATSSIAVLTISVPPTITTQPAAQTAMRQSNVVFTVAASGTAPLTYQWMLEGTPLADDGVHIAGATTNSLTLTNVSPADAGNYSVVVINQSGSATSANALLTVIVPPVITSQPANQTVIQSNTATFNVGVDASSTLPLYYQWHHAGTNVIAGTNASLSIVNAQVADAGTYSVTITNVAGSVLSANATLTVLVRPTISITSPANAAVLEDPANITISATATGNSGSIVQVQFFTGTRLLGTDANGPYSIVWNNPPDGIHRLTAVATDSLGLTATSSVVTISVATSLPPTDDAFVRDGTFQNVKFGTYSILDCRNASTGEARDIYLKFDLTGIHNVSSAKLRLYGHLDSSGTVDTAVYSLTDSSWTEANITWANSPSYSTALVTNSIGTSSTWYLFDISSYVGSQVAGGTNLVSMVVHDPAAVSQVITFNSKENSDNHPSLLVIATNPPLSVNITSPADQSVVNVRSNLTVSATAADTDGNVVSITFFQGTNNVGVATAAPYSVTLSNLVSGIYALTAVATDDQGLTATSSAVTVKVADFITPVADAHVRDGSFVTVNYGTNTVMLEKGNGTHNDGNGYAVYLKFNLANISTNIANATLNVFAGYATSPPQVEMDSYAVTDTNWGEMTITWSNRPALGTLLDSVEVQRNTNQWYQLDITSYLQKQKAAGSNIVSIGLYDSSIESGIVNINSRENLTNQPVIAIVQSNNNPVSVSISSPADGASFGALSDIQLSAAASDTAGTIAAVEFYQGSTSIGVVSAAPYNLTWDNVPAGRYTLTAVARDDHGWARSSAPVSILVESPPQVALTNPVNNAYFIRGDAINLAATASDTGGSVSQVEFFQGTTSLGAVAVAPYGLAWTNAAAGAYTLTAVATDNNGITATSAPVAINVYAAPTILSQPVSQSVLVSNTATFSVTAVGVLPLHYQWEHSGTPLAAQTNATLVLTNVLATDAGNYHVVITNTAGTNTSAEAVLTVIVPGFITSQPTSHVISEGGSATFTVGVASGYTFTYQWYHNGVAISGATSASLTISSATIADAGYYTVTVSTSGSQATSNPATLSFQCCIAVEPIRPANIISP